MSATNGQDRAEDTTQPVKPDDVDLEDGTESDGTPVENPSG